MAPNTILPDDPRLTAYALGEMEAEEKAEFEQQLQHDAAARQTVAEIRATVASLTSALADEPVIEKLGDSLKNTAAIPGRDSRRLDAGPAKPEKILGKKLSFPQFYYLVSGLAAACFAVFFAYWDQHRPVHDVKKYIEVPLASAKSTESLPLAVPALPDDRDSSWVGALKWNTENHAFHRDGNFQKVTDSPLSTFSVAVDTAAYASMRRFIVSGKRPPVNVVRIEELVNYFPYGYAAPDENSIASAGEKTVPHGESVPLGGTGKAPFAANLEVASAPWAPEHRLVRVGLKGREVSEAARPAANLVFLLDVSDSMNEPNKLPLMKQSLRLLVDKLRPDDHVAITVYAGSSGLALPSTAAAHKAEILQAIDSLAASGSTNGALGIQLAYDIAKANFVQGGVNRVILATDGNLNVGAGNEGDLVRLVEEKAKTGVFLSVLGVGSGKDKDETMEHLADKGNGIYAYVDSLAGARKTLVDLAGGTWVAIAKDVKLQVEFNPALVQAYRLIGYENRLLAKEDSNKEKVNAGEIDAGHTVTALYEVVPVGEDMKTVPGVDPLKYQATKVQASAPATAGKELLTVKVRYNEPVGEVSNSLEFPLFDRGEQFADATPDFKFASAVAAFGMILRDSPHKGSATIVDVEAWGRAGLGSDVGGYRNEFLGLVDRSKSFLQ